MNTKIAECIEILIQEKLKNEELKNELPLMEIVKILKEKFEVPCDYFYICDLNGISIYTINFVMSGRIYNCKVEVNNIIDIYEKGDK